MCETNTKIPKLWLNIPYANNEKVCLQQMTRIPALSCALKSDFQTKWCMQNESICTNPALCFASSGKTDIIHMR